jgi:hypothetical protein
MTGHHRVNREAIVGIIAKSIYGGVAAAARTDADSRAEKAVTELERLGYLGPRTSKCEQCGETEDAFCPYADYEVDERPPKCINEETENFSHSDGEGGAGLPPGPATPNREAIERVASELALIDHYDPNQANPDNWSAIAREYEARAERIIAALERAT